MRELVTRLNKPEDIDNLIYQEQNIFNYSGDKLHTLQLDLVKKCFEHHYKNNEHYSKYCKNKKFSSSDIREYRDIFNIPLIPTQMFKHFEIMSVEADQIVKRCTSSGTKGSLSQIFRDEATLIRFMGSVKANAKELFGVEEDDITIFNMGPDIAEAKDLWFSFVMSIMDMLGPSKNYVSNHIFKVEELVNDLVSAGKEKRVAIIGPPIFFVYLCDYLIDNSISIDLNSEALLITAGGWKKFEGEAISREELEERLIKIFKVSAENYRDVFNAVELNSVLFECKHKRKHLPPWVVAHTRDTTTFQPLPDGEEGILCFIDTSADSYPCFLLTDDFGVVYNHNRCGCGLDSPYVEISRRISGVEARGCALKMSKTTKVEDDNAN